MDQYPNNVNQLLNKEPEWKNLNQTTTGTKNNINNSEYSFDELVSAVKDNEIKLNKSIEELKPVIHKTVTVSEHPDYVKKEIVAMENNKKLTSSTYILVACTVMLIVTQGFMQFAFLINAIIMVILIILIRKNIIESIYLSDKYNLKHLFFVTYFRNLRRKKDGNPK